ncbi:MAG TPA: protein kinase [Thermoanaerobaculia bacterium]|nr:protein kinase [Thermoanaerobaculia bacterium]
MIGERIGTYTIVEKLGEGGMGVVYRATDSRLHRDVALKFIPEALAKDPQTMGRFEREAQVLASLNHPNIASIYGLEESGSQRALVMELASGEELAARIQRGRVPLEDALRIALAIAEALEAAHDRAIIHRDLKPANIKLGDGDASGGGRVKILDFGLAKALQGDLATASGVDLTRSPTLSVAATQAGMILGTASYMSPEQARALTADRRADIWSFGVILYEMLTGRRAFVGDTVADTLAKVLEREPDLSLLPPNTPPAIRNLIERCLVKSPRQRLQAIGDARLVIEETLASLARPQSIVETPAGAEPASGKATRKVGLGVLVPWAIAALALAVAGYFAFAGLRSGGSTRTLPPMQVEVAVGSAILDLGLGSSVVLSKDATRLVFIDGNDVQRKLFLRQLDRLEPTLLNSGDSGPTAPYHPFLSPDGQWVGFVTATEMRKMQLSGGTPMKICELSRSRGATWLPDDTIVFAPSPNSGLMRVPAAGGEPKPFTELDAAKGEQTHRWPSSLPDGKHVLFTAHTLQSGFDSATIQVVSVETGERKTIHSGGWYARYVPTGHLVFVNNGTLFAAPFALGSLELTGNPVPVLQELAVSLGEGGAQFDFSESGLLAYVAGSSQVSAYPILWVDAQGGTAQLVPEPGIYANPKLSPDEQKLSLTVMRGDNWDVWVYDLERGVSTRLTFDKSIESEQIWSPDGKWLILSSDKDGPDSLYRKRADGSGELERLTEAKSPQWAGSWSSDGRYVAYITQGQQFDLGYLDLETKETHTFLATEFSEGFPDFSPDGRWLAYGSNESGGGQAIYVRPFPTGEGKWQVSDIGASHPRWSANGRQLFWRTDDGIMVADVETGDGTFRAGKVRQLFSGPFKGGSSGISVLGLQFDDYDVTGDGQRFVMFPDAQKAGRGDHAHVVLVTDWFGDLERATKTTAK